MDRRSPREQRHGESETVVDPRRNGAADRVLAGICEPFARRIQETAVTRTERVNAAGSQQGGPGNTGSDLAGILPQKQNSWSRAVRSDHLTGPDYRLDRLQNPSEQYPTPFRLLLLHKVCTG